jgi:hypothetical protein
MFNNSVKDLFKEASDNRFKDFITKRITLAYYSTFLVGRKINLNSRLNNSKLKLGRIRNVRLYRKNLPPLP